MQLVDPNSGSTGGRCNNKDGGSGVGGNGLYLELVILDQRTVQLDVNVPFPCLSGLLIIRS